MMSFSVTFLFLLLSVISRLTTRNVGASDLTSRSTVNESVTSVPGPYPTDGAVPVHDKSLIILKLGPLTTVKLDPNVYAIKVKDIPSSINVVVAEFHVQKYNLTLSLYSNPTYTTSVTGRSGGVLQKLAYEARDATWYLQSDLNDTVIAYLKVSGYYNDDPVPGACNQEFPLPNDPNIHLSYGQSTVRLSFQYANIGTMRGSTEPDCEDSSVWKSLQYEVFQLYLNEGDLSESHFQMSVARMTDLETIRNHAYKVASFTRGKGLSHMDLAAYEGQGVMYTVIVSHTKDKKVRQAMYIVNTDYGCNFDGHVKNCYNLESSFLPITKVISIICAGLGLYMCFLGHRFFKLQMCIFGCLAFMLTFYIVLSVTTNLDYPIIIILSSVIGLVGGALWLGFWWNVGIPVLSELLVGLVLGFLFSSILFYTPFGLIEIWRSSFNYGMGFVCGILLVPVVLLYFTKTLSIISCAVFGSYSLVFCIGLYLRCSIPYIIINAMRKAVIPGFVTAVVTAPFQLFDVILVLVWVVLAIIGSVFQFIRERERPPFPPCPRTAKSRNRELQLLAEESADMRRPLLPESRRSRRPNESRRSPARKNYGTYKQIDAQEANEIA
ncbi:transmembrane 7 superfamily member 3-like isoform X1 [Lineus longissimus]|uniref:transmembrane 7 superfamily member 3-like isoform X1 n=1 Tax=Lineus longissimus TaxID=88925 RepID=UPI002B4DE58F